MKRLLLILVTVLFFGSCNGNKPKEDVVYVCTGNYATKYHADINCRWLSACKCDVIEITKNEAQEAGRTPCKACNKK